MSHLLQLLNKILHLKRQRLLIPFQNTLSDPYSILLHIPIILLLLLLSEQSLMEFPEPFPNSHKLYLIFLERQREPYIINSLVYKLAKTSLTQQTMRNFLLKPVQNLEKNLNRHTLKLQSSI